MDILIRGAWTALLLVFVCGCSANGGFPDGGGVGGGPASASDTDGDGVPNSRDQCPGTQPGASVDEFGCSADQAPSEPDSDGDGVVDGSDQCPGTEPGASVDAVGCSADQISSEPDSDGDGVIDSEDQCPNTPPGEEVDENGCSQGQEQPDEPLIADLGEEAGLISEIAEFTCTETPFGLGEEITIGAACELGDTLGLTLCQTLNPEAAADGIGNGSTSAIVQLVTSLLVLPPLPTVDLIARAGVRTSGFGAVAEGNVAGFFVTFPTDVVDASVLQSLSVTTFLGGAEQETRDLLQPLNLGLGGVRLIGGSPVLVGFENTLPYDAVEILFGGTVEAEAIDPTTTSPDPSALLGDVASLWNVCTAADPPAAR